MTQAREFWLRVDAKRLLELEDKGWELWPNLHFSFAQIGLYRASTPLAVNKYIELWKSGEMEIIALFRDDSDSFRHNWDRLVASELISPDDVEPLEEKTTKKKYPQIFMSPGLAISYTWWAKQADQLDQDGAFVCEVKERIREVTETWGEVPDFCREE